MIHTEETGPVRVLRLAHGKANALDVELLREIVRQIESFEQGPARACVLTGSGSIFSAGADLKRLANGGDAYLDEFLPALDDAFRALFFCPKPVVAACNGHAIAGGCILLQACDLRLGAQGRGKVGAPELAVGVPFPLLALEILRFATPVGQLQTLLYSGGVFGMEASLERGLVDELVPEEALGRVALERAEALAAYPAVAFAATKRLLRSPVAERLASMGAADRAETRRSWGSDAVRDAVRAHVERTLG